ncbi:unnamed protein product [Soboliphyme baturini]|uniref:G-patch domain-containing protein n=1 Tax=Soboliphyme baturini TaxID=241478 RepID=A0A183IRZ1_9BILA|nr:unnamed protein product [Soboliphyme baturini]
MSFSPIFIYYVFCDTRYSSDNAKRRSFKKILQNRANELNKAYSRKDLERLNREEALNTAIGQENKGYSLLTKMGYKPGMKLGKPNSLSESSGLAEPIKPVIKPDKGGLGRSDDNERKRRLLDHLRKELSTKRQQLNEDFLISRDEFREVEHFLMLWSLKYITDGYGTVSAPWTTIAGSCTIFMHHVIRGEVSEIEMLLFQIIANLT